VKTTCPHNLQLQNVLKNCSDMASVLCKILLLYILFEVCVFHIVVTRKLKTVANPMEIFNCM